MTLGWDLVHLYVKKGEYLYRLNFFCLKLDGAHSIVVIPFLSRSWRFYWGRHAHLHVYLCGLQLADLAGTFDFYCHIQVMVCHFPSPVFHYILWLHGFCDLNRIFMVKARIGPWKRTPDVEKFRLKMVLRMRTYRYSRYRTKLLFITFLFLIIASWNNCDNFVISIYISVICVWRV